MTMFSRVLCSQTMACPISVLPRKNSAMQRLLTRLGLRFEDADEERRFIDQYVRGSIGWTQVAMLLGVVTYAGYTFWDWVLYPEVVPITFAIRGGTAFLVLLPLTALLSLPVKARAEAIYLVYCVVPGCVLPSVYLVLPSGFTYAAAGMIMVILFVSTMLPLRVGSLAVFCVSTWIALVVAESFAPELPGGLRFINHFLVGNAYALSLYGVGAREYQARKQFRTAEALQREKLRSEASLEELRETQARLVQAEKLASLGQLVAGVAHEVSTPLGLALTTSTAMESDLKAMERALNGSPVRRSDLTRSMGRFGEGLRMTFDNLNRASDMLYSFKQVAIDHADEDRSTFELSDWLLELIAKRKVMLSRLGLTVEIVSPTGIAVNSYPGALAQVISNLALNAAVHAYPDGKGGVFRVTVTQPDPKTVRIVCADSGVGIPDELKANVFDPFFTTRRDKGHTGLGLHVVFNAVMSTLRGRIELESEPNSGTQVSIEIPT